jgi:hypothetical protein
MRDTMLTEFASRQTTVRRFLEEYRSWISWNSHGDAEDVNRANYGLVFPRVLE